MFDILYALIVSFNSTVFQFVYEVTRFPHDCLNEFLNLLSLLYRWVRTQLTDLTTCFAGFWIVIQQMFCRGIAKINMKSCILTIGRCSCVGILADLICHCIWCKDNYAIKSLLHSWYARSPWPRARCGIRNPLESLRAYTCVLLHFNQDCYARRSLYSYWTMPMKLHISRKHFRVVSIRKFMCITPNVRSPWCQFQYASFQADAHASDIAQTRPYPSIICLGTFAPSLLWCCRLWTWKKLSRSLEERCWMRRSLTTHSLGSDRNDMRNESFNYHIIYRLSVTYNVTVNWHCQWLCDQSVTYVIVSIKHKFVMEYAVQWIEDLVND